MSTVSIPSLGLSSGLLEAVVALLQNQVALLDKLLVAIQQLCNLLVLLLNACALLKHVLLEPLAFLDDALNVEHQHLQREKKHGCC